MVTDPARKRREDKGTPEICPVYFFHTIFNKENQQTVAHECRNALRGCVDCKKEMLSHLLPFLKPIYERRQELSKNRGKIRDILIEGSRKAQAVAAKTLAEAKEAAGIGI
jgi:tryptophanyl-tRNA synthetase